MGKLKALVGIALVAGLFMYLWSWVPIKFNNSEFQDGLDDIARKMSYTQRPDDEVRQMVIEKAKSLNIAVKEDQITLTRSYDGIGIVVHYHAHFDFPVIPYDKDFVVASMNKRI
jgi:hypothetical protein